MMHKGKVASFKNSIGENIAIAPLFILCTVPNVQMNDGAQIK